MSDNPDSRSGLELAYIGDAIFELMVRERIFAEGTSRAGRLHSRSVALVCAPAQAAMAGAIEPLLDEKEHAVFLRGRNAHPKTVSKAASHADYMRATALEALFGWLHLTGQVARIKELFDLAMESASNLNK